MQMLGIDIRTDPIPLRLDLRDLLARTSEGWVDSQVMKVHR